MENQTTLQDVKSENQGIMCPQCGSHNVQIQMIQTKATTKTTGHKRGLLWKIGRLTLIICTCGLWLLVGRSKGKDKSKTKFKNEKVCICQSCGNSWEIK